jgi:hypothetical protein
MDILDDEFERIPLGNLPPPVEYIPAFSPQDVEPQISLHALTGIYTP